MNEVVRAKATLRVEFAHRAEAISEARLRVGHGALTRLLVPTPDRALANEIHVLLAEHNQIVDDDGSI